MRRPKVWVTREELGSINSVDFHFEEPIHKRAVPLHISDDQRYQYRDGDSDVVVHSADLVLPGNPVTVRYIGSTSPHWLTFYYDPDIDWSRIYAHVLMTLQMHDIELEVVCDPSSPWWKRFMSAFTFSEK